MAMFLTVVLKYSRINIPKELGKEKAKSELQIDVLSLLI